MFSEPKWGTESNFGAVFAVSVGDLNSLTVYGADSQQDYLTLVSIEGTFIMKERLDAFVYDHSYDDVVEANIASKGRHRDYIVNYINIQQFAIAVSTG